MKSRSRYPKCGWVSSLAQEGPRLTRLLGVARAKEMVLTGRRVSGRQAAAWGLVHEAVPRADFDATVADVIRNLAEAGPVALGAAKAAIDEGYGQPWAEALRCERMHYEKTLGTDDRLEGLAAFAQKRPPNYQGR